MKKIVWRTGNRMLIDTGCKTFDRQCDGLMTGNVSGKTQSSSYIRARTETKCNSTEFPLGQLRDFDLKQFNDIPEHLLDKIKEATEKESAILYEIRHWNGRQKIVHGWILTRGDDRDHALIWTQINPWLRRWEASSTILRVATEYLSNDPKGAAEREFDQAIDRGLKEFYEANGGVSIESFATS